MNEKVRRLLEQTQTRMSEHQQDLMQLAQKETKNTPDTILNIRGVLTPLEIDIRKIELDLKLLQVNLKNSAEYDSSKTVKAKEEQMVIDTYDIKQNLLTLKGERNKLRDTLEYQQNKIQLEGEPEV